jgi:CspA family cold shock protein
MLTLFFCQYTPDSRVQHASLGVPLHSAFLWISCCINDRTPMRAPTTKEVPMPTGTVKWFNTTKGYGFIAPDNGGKDIFVHISAVERAGMTGLADNQKVSYELIEGRDGRQSAGELKAI